MDHTIEELFRKKNDKILIEKLLLDIANNDDSLRLTINNKIELMTSKLQRRLNIFLKTNGIDYDIKTLTELLDKHKNKIKDFVVEKLVERKENYEKDVKMGTTKLNVETTENERKNLNETLNVGMNKIIYVDMLNEILTMYTFTDKSQKDELIDKCLKKYDFELYSAIEDSILDRNKSLENVMNETRDKVDKMNEKTSSKFLEKKKKNA